MSALECCRRQAGSDRSPAAWICIRPPWSPSSTLLSRPPPGPRRRRRRPGPASRRPHRADRARRRPGPLTAGQLTHAPGMAAAAHHSRQCRRPGQPGPGGPLALRRIPPGTWTVTPPGHPHPGAAPRPAQSHRRHHPRRRPARVPPAGQSATYADLRAQPGWAAAKPNSWKPGLSYSINGPDEVHVGDDVKIQPPLQRRRPHRPRARRAPLRWTSPQHIRPEVPRPGRVPASEHPGGAR
jgi:hypothetical protein